MPLEFPTYYSVLESQGHLLKLRLQVMKKQT